MSKKHTTPAVSDTHEKTMSGSQLMIIISIIIIFTAFAFSFFSFGNLLNLDPVDDDPGKIVRGNPPIVDDTIVCEEYGTYSVDLQDFLEQYVTIEKDTFSEISMKHFNTASKATDIQEVNSIYMGYNLDDELPENVIIYIPDQKYEMEGVTAYIKTYGNISYDDTYSEFTVSAPSSGSGPFKINSEVDQMLLGIDDGDCIVVEYGSGGFDSNKPVFDLYLQ